MLEERRADVLRALVEVHIATGEPVSSRSILERTGLGVSAATIRNDLAALERDGLVVQPHTSAGRVPTARAYRYYVDHLGPGRLAASTNNRIAGFFSSVQMELGKLLKATSQLLAEVTHYPAVVIGPHRTQEKVRTVRLVSLSPDNVLLVVVTDSGRILQEHCRIDQPLSLAEVAGAEQLINHQVVGRELGVALVSEEGVEQAEVVRLLAGAVGHLLSRSGEAMGEVYVGGTGQMTTVWNNLTAIHRVLEVLEREAEVLNLLANASGTSIRIGDELGDLVDMAVVSTTYEGAAGEGSIGVIGPMRMDYKKTISAVERVGQELGDRIGS